MARLFKKNLGLQKGLLHLIFIVCVHLKIKKKNYDKYTEFIQHLKHTDKGHFICW